MKAFFIVVLLVGVVMVSRAKIGKLLSRASSKKMSMSISIGASCVLKNGFKSFYCGKIRNKYVFSFYSKKSFGDSQIFTFYLSNNQSFLLGRKKYVFSSTGDKFKFKTLKVK